MDDEELLARPCQDVVGRCDGAWRSIAYRAEFGAGWFACDEDVDGEGRARAWPADGLVDLAPPARLRTLRSVEVSGGATVEVPPWPRLVEVSGGAVVTNLDSLPEAVFLTPHADQWRRLDAPPTGLAAAGLVGHDSPAHAAEWAAWLGAPVRVSRGTF